MKNRILLTMCSIVLILSGCGEDNSAKAKTVKKVKTLTEYEQGYEAGLGAYRTNSEMKVITDDISNTLKYAKKPLGTVSSGSISMAIGRGSVICSKIAYGTDSYKTRPEFTSGLQKGCLDKLSMLAAGK